MDKYKAVWYYDQIFSTGMKNRWECLVYLDLFAGAGHARIKDSERIVQSSALLALNVPNRFSKYIFCENTSKCMTALRNRVTRDYEGANVSFVPGDCNLNLRKILGEMPPSVLAGKSLTFCFVDPFNLHLRWSTISSLSSACQRIDFLVLLALKMDGRRNEAIYMREGSRVVESLLADPDWRSKWIEAKRQGRAFVWFVANKFAEKMFAAGYIRPRRWRMMDFQNEKGSQLYHLVMPHGKR